MKSIKCMLGFHKWNHYLTDENGEPYSVVDKHGKLKVCKCCGSSEQNNAKR